MAPGAPLVKRHAPEGMAGAAQAASATEHRSTHADGALRRASIALLRASRYPVATCLVMAPHVFVEEIAIQAIDEARRLYETDQGERGLRQRQARHHADVDNAIYQSTSGSTRSFGVSTSAKTAAPFKPLCRRSWG